MPQKSVIQIPKTIGKIDENITTPRSSIQYPYVRVLDFKDALALIIPALPSGPLQLIATYKGVTRQISCIEKSALTLSKLVSITRLEYVHAKGDATLLQNNTDIMEMSNW